eukprot:15335966-Ditylum_brightwellii.AAC.1
MKGIQDISIAISMLLKSLKPGNYANYTQSASVRKLRSTYSNAYLASAKSVEEATSVGRNTNKMHLVHCPTHSTWFERFALGCRSKMREIIKPDRAILIEKVLGLLRIVDDLGKEATSYETRKSIILLGAFVAIAYAGSFQGHEVFLVDTHGLLKYKDEGRKESEDNECVLIPLLGRFNGETGESAISLRWQQILAWVLK